jgi:hypothetical protein
MAQCPAHEDKHPSLSIRELSDGRVLVHCFAGCNSEPVLAAIALEFADLYPPRRGRARQRSARPPTHFTAEELLKIVSHEVTVAALVLADLLEHRAASEEHWTRLAAAAARIGQAQGHLHDR